MKVNNNFLLVMMCFIVFVGLLNIVNVILFSITESGFFVNVAPALKDLFLIFIFSFLSLSAIVSGKIEYYYRKIFYLTAIYFLFVLFSFVKTDATLTFSLMNIRRIFEWMVIIFTFSLISLRLEQYRILLKVTYYLGLLIFLFGLVGMIAPVQIWDEVFELPKFWNESDFATTPIESIKEGGGKTYTSDLVFITGEKTRRMISTYVEATTLGIFFTFLFTYAAFTKLLPNKLLFLAVSFMGGVLVFSKSFMVSVLVVAFFSIYRRLSIAAYYFGFALLLVVGFYIYHKIGKVHGGLSHIIGFYTGLELLIDKPLGFGLGMAGNRGQASVGVVNGLNGGESGLGNVTAQIGVLGLFTLYIIHTIIKTFKRNYRETGSMEYYAIFVVTVNWAVTYFLSASSLGLTGNYIFFIFIGLLLNPFLRNELNQNAV